METAFSLPKAVQLRTAARALLLVAMFFGYVFFYRSNRSLSYQLCLFGGFTVLFVPLAIYATRRKYVRLSATGMRGRPYKSWLKHQQVSWADPIWVKETNLPFLAGRTFISIPTGAEIFIPLSILRSSEFQLEASKHVPANHVFRTGAL